MRSVLFAVSEAFPLLKTGGLGDVAGSLPPALRALGEDVVLLLPAYPGTAARLQDLHPLTQFHTTGYELTLLAGTLPGEDLPVWLLDCPALYDRPGSPYVDQNQQPWADNPERFALLSRVAARIAMGGLGLPWRPDVVHTHDWQTALTHAYLADQPQAPAQVFTIHNLAYQGLFPREIFGRLELASFHWQPRALEFYGKLSFIKAGLVYADRITTVSPTYAKEIQTSAFGYGLEGLLRHRQARLCGVLNGIDTRQWNPISDKHLAAHYDANDLDRKALNKASLQHRLGLATQASYPLIGYIGRLVEQKGIDLILQAIPELVQQPLQLVFLSAGDAYFEQALIYWARRYPERIAVQINFDEALSHQIEAAADFFLMPSRFEPCGLNQMYSQRYGTVPIVHSVGGLTDTVCDAVASTIADNSATGIVFREPSYGALSEAVKRALLLYANPTTFRRIQQSGMAQNFSWQRSARTYQDIYSAAQQDRRQP